MVAPPIIRIFLCGDVMTGRGIDQALPHPSAPRLHESYITSAVEYLRLAERAHGPIPQPLGFRDLWGKAAEELSCARPDARVINLETSITRSEAYAQKGINYRMSPENAGCLVAGAIDCCVLANNHILDWRHEGLRETLSVLRHLNIKTAGAGEDLAQAQAPAILEIPQKGRLIIFSFACVTSGTPRNWEATFNTAGVNLLPSLCEQTVTELARQVAQTKKRGDVVVVSIHWGPNWGYEVDENERWFAHELIERAGVSVVYGHSSHHPKAIELYHNRLILYGCGDFLNDYEGINGYEEFRGDLALMYLVDVDPTSGEVRALELVPFQVQRFQLVRAQRDDVDWLQHTLDRESRILGTCIRQKANGRLVVQPLNVRTASETGPTQKRRQRNHGAVHQRRRRCGDRRIVMLKALKPDQTHFIAVLAKTARAQRDTFLGSVREDAFGEPKAARGEHNPTAALGLEVNAASESQIAALRYVITKLSPRGRAELYTLMRVGQGDLAAQKWQRGIVDAAGLGDETVTAALIEDPDLHDHLLKGLYEAKLVP